MDGFINFAVCSTAHVGSGEHAAGDTSPHVTPFRTASSTSAEVMHHRALCRRGLFAAEAIVLLGRGQSGIHSLFHVVARRKLQLFFVIVGLISVRKYVMIIISIDWLSTDRFRTGCSYSVWEKHPYSNPQKYANLVFAFTKKCNQLKAKFELLPQQGLRNLLKKSSVETWPHPNSMFKTYWVRHRLPACN